MLTEFDVPAFCPCCGAEGLLPLIWPEGKHMDIETGIWPIHEWGFATTQGHVSDSRFGSGLVIKRTNRAKTKKWRRAPRQSTTPEGKGL